MSLAGAFEMLKIGVGPSSSHTLGPWQAARSFAQELVHSHPEVSQVQVNLYGSLALTGRGHCSDIALIMGLGGWDPQTVPLDLVKSLPSQVHENRSLDLGGTKSISFNPDEDILFHHGQRLDFHANGMVFSALDQWGNRIAEKTGYSIGGGFVQWEDELQSAEENQLPFIFTTGHRLVAHCIASGLSIAGIARANEESRISPSQVSAQLGSIWKVMAQSIYRGCHTSGVLPGPLGAERRAASIANQVLPPEVQIAPDWSQWLLRLKLLRLDFTQTLRLISACAMAVNEENADLGRIVTAPTNGSAGVIPAVLLYRISLFDHESNSRVIEDFLLTAALVGAIFKDGATISAAMGGCQAEIGVSSAMAAAALTESLGGTVTQSLMAAEIAMEHHLGLTCDPIAGLVQVPCIERNSMGAIKAITAAYLALDGDSSKAKVSFDEVVQTMWATANNMDSKYKETSLGGLAVNVSVRVPEC